MGLWRVTTIVFRGQGEGEGEGSCPFPSEEIASEKVGEEETPFVVRNRLWESRFRASVSDRKGKGVIRFCPDNVADGEEIVSITDIEPREDENNEDNM